MKLVKEIRNRAGVLHFKRWELFTFRGRRIYLHQILKKDEDAHLHDHPWDFTSIILWGKYIEQRDDGYYIRGWLSVARMKAKGQHHKIHDIVIPVWSLVIAGPNCHTWGYQTEKGWIESQEYRQRKREDRL